MSNSYVSIYVKNMRIPVRIGLLDFEKQAPQDLDISVEVFAAPTYLANDSIMDYSILHDHIQSWRSRPHTELLETLLLDLAHTAFQFNTAEAVEISISKPDIFDDAQQAGIKARLTRQDIPQ